MPSFGAVPPDDLAWMVGKTRASIDFVHEAERWLKEKRGTKGDRVQLKNAIARLKAGTLSFDHIVTPEVFLDQM